MKKKTHEQFIKEVYDLVGDEYTVLEEYINARTKIKIKHNKCGDVYFVKPNHFLSGIRCPNCSRKIPGLKRRKTHEQFKKEVFNLVGNEYEVLEEYVNSRTKIKVIHNKCGHEYKVRPRNFLKGNRCPKCRKKSDEQFKNEVYALVKDEYTFLEEYKGIDIKIKVIHNKCGHEYEVTPNSFLNGRRCPYCSGVKKKTTEQFKKEVYDLVGNEYEILGEYVNSYTKIKIKHVTCGHIYEVTSANFLRGSKCPKCSGKKTHEQFVKEVFNLVGNEYTIIGEYIKSSVKIKIKHNKCGHIYEVTPTSFLRGNRCPICYGTHRKTTKQFKKEVYDLVGEEYEVIGDYINAHAKIKVIHRSCGNEYYVRPHDFIKGTRCPICKHSKGEEKIAKYLTKFGIKYETQKTFEDLKDRNFLRFDFYLPDKNLIIEYDGIQHYEPVNFGGCTKEQAEENFKNQQTRDKIKNEYCNENNINLLRIKYTDFKNINKIIKQGWE